MGDLVLPDADEGHDFMVSAPVVLTPPRKRLAPDHEPTSPCTDKQRMPVKAEESRP